MMMERKLQSNDQIKKKEKELNDKEKELYEWETSLFQKNLQLEEMFEQYGFKMNKMALQKQEIQENVKKLQLLTQDYAVFIAKEDQIKLAEAEIAN